MPPPAPERRAERSAERGLGQCAEAATSPSHPSIRPQILAEAWPVFQERSVAVSVTAYKKVGLYPFKRADEVKRTSADLLLVQNAGGDVTAADFEEAQEWEREEERAVAAEARNKQAAAEAAEMSARREALLERQRDETQARIARHAAEAKEERERHQRELKALEAGASGSGAAKRRRGVSFASTEAELAEGRQRSMAMERAAQAAGAAAAPSAEQDAITQQMLTGQLTVPEAMSAALDAPAAPSQLYMPAFVASGGEVVIRQAVAVSAAKRRGLTQEQEVARLTAEQAAKKLKGRRKAAKGSIVTKKGAVVTRDAIAKLRADAEETQNEIAEKAVASEGRKRKRVEKVAGIINEGKALAERADIVSARAAGNQEALTSILQKLKNAEKVALITAIDPSKMPAKKQKKELGEALAGLTYWTELDEQLVDFVDVAGALPPTLILS